MKANTGADVRRKRLLRHRCLTTGGREPPQDQEFELSGQVGHSGVTRGGDPSLLGLGLGCTCPQELPELSHLTLPWESSPAGMEVAKVWPTPRGASPHTHSRGCRRPCSGSPPWSWEDAGAGRQTSKGRGSSITPKIGARRDRSLSPVISRTSPPAPGTSAAALGVLRCQQGKMCENPQTWAHAGLSFEDTPCSSRGLSP